MLKAILPVLSDFCQEEDGATAVEYAIILVLIITVVIVTVGLLGEKTTGGYDKFNKTFQPS